MTTASRVHVCGAARTEWATGCGDRGWRWRVGTAEFCVLCLINALTGGDKRSLRRAFRARFAACRNGR